MKSWIAANVFVDKYTHEPQFVQIRERLKLYEMPTGCYADRIMLGVNMNFDEFLEIYTDMMYDCGEPRIRYDIEKKRYYCIIDSKRIEFEHRVLNHRKYERASSGNIAEEAGRNAEAIDRARDANKLDPYG